jgi:hypothetical protein
MAVVTHVAQYLDLDALQLPPFVYFVGAKVGRGLQQPSARQHGKWELNMDGSQQHLPFFASIHGALHMLRTAGFVFETILSIGSCWGQWYKYEWY